MFSLFSEASRHSHWDHIVAPANLPNVSTNICTSTDSAFFFFRSLNSCSESLRISPLIKTFNGKKTRLVQQNVSSNRRTEENSKAYQRTLQKILRKRHNCSDEFREEMRMLGACWHIQTNFRRRVWYDRYPLQLKGSPRLNLIAELLQEQLIKIRLKQASSF